MSTYTAHTSTVHGLVWVNEYIFITGCEAGQIIAHDIRTGEVVWSNYLLNSLNNDNTKSVLGVCCLHLLYGDTASNSSKPRVYGVAGYSSGIIAVFNIESGQLLVYERLHHDDIRSITSFPYQHNDLDVHDGANSSGVVNDKPMQGNLLITTSFDGTGNIWKFNEHVFKFEKITQLLNADDTHTDKLLCVASVGAVYSTSASNDDTLISKPTEAVLTSGADGRIVLWRKKIDYKVFYH